MASRWYVAVAEHRRDELAEMALVERGFAVHVPRRWQREKTYRGVMKLTAELLITPYFFVKFDSDPALSEYATVLRQRGMSHVLESRPQVPGQVPSSLIAEHRARELAERAAQQYRSRSHIRTDLILNAVYRITRHELWKGHTGKLIAVGNGMAHLAVGRMRVSLPDCDIAAVVDQKQGVA